MVVCMSLNVTVAACNGTRVHVFLWCSRRDTNRVLRLVYPVYDMRAYICKVHVFTKQAKRVTKSWDRISFCVCLHSCSPFQPDSDLKYICVHTTRESTAAESCSSVAATECA